MRRSGSGERRGACRVLRVLLLLGAVVPQPSRGDPLREELAQMGERLGELEEALDATREELRASRKRVDAQAERLARVDPDAGEELAPGWSRFLAQTEFSAWVATSYTYNFNRPKGNGGLNGNIGNPKLGAEAEGLVYAFHPNDDRFELDQLWFSLQKAARPDSRGGFAVDLVFGQSADALGDYSGQEVSRPYLFQAYVEYLVPMGPGLRVRAGQVNSQIGAEYVEAVKRWAISDGLVDGQLHPDPQLGVSVRSDWPGVWLLFGIANDAALNPGLSVGKSKAFLWGGGLDLTENLSLALNGLWGDSGELPGRTALDPDGGTHTNRVGIVDAVLRWQPSDRFGAWLDFTYMWSEDLESVPCSATADAPMALQKVPGNPRAVGLAAASRYAFAESTWFSLRGEGLWGRDNQLDPRLCDGTQQHSTLWAITGTLEHDLLDNLGVRAEGRWDAGSRPGRNDFFQGRELEEYESDQWTASVQAYYRF